MASLEWRVAHRGELLGLASGFPSIDQTMSGWQAGDLTVIGARPSIGKTTFLLNTALSVASRLAEAHNEAAVLLFSFEMTREQLEFRILSMLSGIALTQIINGAIMSQDWGKLSIAMGRMSELPIVIDDTSGQTRWQIRSTCRRVRAERGLALVGIDYVQLIPGSLDRRGATRTEELTDVSRGLKELAKELHVPVILLSQLSRPSRMFAKDAEPALTDLRDCGALEQDADNVGFLHRKDHRAGGATAFLLKKQRSGPTGSMMLALDRDTVTFTDAPEATLAPAPEERKAEKKGGGKKTTLYRKDPDEE
jgi:replicative DNA helicase